MYEKLFKNLLKHYLIIHCTCHLACGIKPGENILSELGTLIDGSNMGDNIIGLMRDGVFPSLKRLSLIRSRITPSKVGNLSQFVSKIQTTGIDCEFCQFNRT